MLASSKKRVARFLALFLPLILIVVACVLFVYRQNNPIREIVVENVSTDEYEQLSLSGVEGVKVILENGTAVQLFEQNKNVGERPLKEMQQEFRNIYRNGDYIEEGFSWRNIAVSFADPAPDKVVLYDYYLISFGSTFLSKNPIRQAVRMENNNRFVFHVQSHPGGRFDSKLTRERGYKMICHWNKDVKEYLFIIGNPTRYTITDEDTGMTEYEYYW